MITLIILIYIATIFLGRYLDIKVQIYIHQIHYKTYIEYFVWFIPIINLVVPLTNYLGHEIETRKLDIKHSKFINWFFVGVNYKTKENKCIDKELDEFFKSKHKIGGEVPKDLLNDILKDSL
jgi:C4-dicarboxylate transporter